MYIVLSGAVASVVDLLRFSECAAAASHTPTALLRGGRRCACWRSCGAECGTPPCTTHMAESSWHRPRSVHTPILDDACNWNGFTIVADGASPWWYCRWQHPRGGKPWSCTHVAMLTGARAPVDIMPRWSSTPRTNTMRCAGRTRSRLGTNAVRWIPSACRACSPCTCTPLSHGGAPAAAAYRGGCPLGRRRPSRQTRGRLRTCRAAAVAARCALFRPARARCSAPSTTRFVAVGRSSAS